MSSFCDPVDCNPPSSSVPGILQARVLEWVAISFSKESSRPRDQTQVSCTAGGFFRNWAPREAPADIPARLTFPFCMHWPLQCPKGLPWLGPFPGCLRWGEPGKELLLLLSPVQAEELTLAEQALEVSGGLGWAPYSPLATQCRTVQLSEPLLPRLLQKTFQSLPFGCLRLRQQGSAGSARDDWVPPSMGAPCPWVTPSMGAPRPLVPLSMGAPCPWVSPSMGAPHPLVPPSMGAPVHGCPRPWEPPVHGCPRPWVPPVHGCPRPWVPPSMGAPCPWVPPIHGCPLSMGAPIHGSPPIHWCPSPWVPPSMGAPVYWSPLSMGAPHPWVPQSMGAPVHGSPPSMGAPRPWVPPSIGATHPPNRIS